MPTRVCKNCEKDISSLHGNRRYCDECRHPWARQPLLMEDYPDTPDMPDWPIITVRWDYEMGLPVVDIGEDLHPIFAHVMLARAAEKVYEMIPEALMSFELE